LAPRSTKIKTIYLKLKKGKLVVRFRCFIEFSFTTTLKDITHIQPIAAISSGRRKVACIYFNDWTILKGTINFARIFPTKNYIFNQIKDGPGLPPLKLLDE
jgi:hypothetical protein